MRPYINPTKHGSWQIENEARWSNRTYCSGSCAKRSKNPMHSAKSREKMSQTLRDIGHQPPVRGGNGLGLTSPQAKMLKLLGEGWVAEFVVRTGHQPSADGPNHYKIDLANPTRMIAIELDGGSHYSLKAQERDSRKDEFLASKGWLVFRLKNEQAMNLCSICTSPGTLLTSLMAA